MRYRSHTENFDKNYFKSVVTLNRRFQGEGDAYGSEEVFTVRGIK